MQYTLTNMESLKPQHTVEPPKESTLTVQQQENLMQIDRELEILFPQMEADYKEMHRLPKKLSFD